MPPPSLLVTGGTDSVAPSLTGEGAGVNAFDVGSLSARRTMVAAAAILLAYTLINPVGFLGGGMDDWQYLNAARCWVAHGPCLPYDHWQARWPLVAPLALAIRLIGENRISVGFPSLLATIACVPPLAMIGNRLFAPPVGFGGALLFLLTPIVGVELYDPNVETIELAFVAWGFLALMTGRDDPQLRWPAAAGLLFALAFQTRETALAPIAVAGIWAACSYPRERLARAAVAASAAFLVPLLIEFTAFWDITGDPLYRRTLSLRHVLIPSTQLNAPIDPSSSPLFNPHYIANWRHEPGLHLHWAIDGLANFLVNSRAGIAQWCGPLLLWLYAGHVPTEDRRKAWLAFATALTIASGLIYALAIDPKARMLYSPIALCCLMLAMVLLSLERSDKRLIARAIILVSLFTALSTVAIFQQVHDAEPLARHWIARAPGRIATDPNTKRTFALVHEVERLPAPGKVGTDLMLTKIEKMTCDRWLRLSGLDALGWRVVEQSSLSYISLVSNEVGGELCLFDAGRTIDAATFAAAVERIRRAQARRGAVF